MRIINTAIDQVESIGILGIELEGTSSFSNIKPSNEQLIKISGHAMYSIVPDTVAGYHYCAAFHKNILWTFYELFHDKIHIWERHTSVALDGDLLYLFYGN